MISNAIEFKGVVHGNVIELERSPNLPDGEQVTVLVQRTPRGPTNLPPGEGLRRAFGAWADKAEQVDGFLEQLRRDRDADDRAEPTA